ncbi:MAG: hypothetical protein AB2A00_20375, partial [Myxococcota bacterium]
MDRTLEGKSVRTLGRNGRAARNGNGIQARAKLARAATQPPPHAEPSDSALFVNRELSWLEFNERVLEEAMDPTVPLAERCKFIGIVSGNLDEFFMVRVAGLKQQQAGAVNEPTADGLTPAESLAAVATRAHQQAARQSQCLNGEVLPQLRERGVRLLQGKDLDPEQRAFVAQIF